MNIEQLAALFSVLRFQGRAVLHAGQCNAQLLRHQPHRLRKGDILDFLDKAEHIAGNSAAEAVKELAGSVDGKRRRLLLVKWAERLVVRACAFQRKIRADYFDDVIRRRDLLDCFRRNGHA